MGGERRGGQGPQLSTVVHGQSVCSAVWPSLRHSALTASEPRRQSLLVGRSREEVDTTQCPTCGPSQR